ncbi:MAG: hypothetical protein DRR16_23555 [Candidatus Parabeggiatoa sp. nov. 3]|nr:MAG: hypothetical protein DRR00_17725 [Gammaproteobacteria bacterium]RKZ68293.1 MAG: hypothetical protein DRQ99_04195 [Gammaproteobacteria bacterium]RKZ80612.1 MAG: hypothetical protein DRR16_23555 [Gammaproteobacteria bacterium]
MKMTRQPHDQYSKEALLEILAFFGGKSISYQFHISRAKLLRENQFFNTAFTLPKVLPKFSDDISVLSFFGKF